MNAYELADELLRDNTQLTVKAAYMLRQQADRIAELEKQSEPYGYVWTSLKDCMETRFTRMYPIEFYKPIDIVPVYTTPQTKPLSDEEQDACFNRGYKEGVRDSLSKTKPLSDEDLEDCWYRSYGNTTRAKYLAFYKAIKQKESKNETNWNCL